MSGSRVIMRFAISPQVNPSGRSAQDPQHVVLRGRQVLGLQDTRSARARAYRWCAASPGTQSLPGCRRLLHRLANSFITQIYRCNDYCQDDISRISSRLSLPLPAPRFPVMVSSEFSCPLQHRLDRRPAGLAQLLFMPVRNRFRKRQRCRTVQRGPDRQCQLRVVFRLSSC